MITVQEAVKTLENKYPNSRIVSCVEYDDSYMFNVVPRRWNGDPWDAPAGGSVDCIRKSNGELFFRHLSELLDDDRPTKNVDIGNYLSKEDSDFIVLMKQKESNA